MSGLKRSRTTMEADDSDHGFSLSDDEPVTMGRQSLPVARLPANFNGEPVDGMQYLFAVRREARKLPSYTRVPNPYVAAIAADASKSAAPVSVPDQSTHLQRRPRVPLPSEEWRNVFLQRFKNFRKNLQQPTIGAIIPAAPAGSKAMPDKKERDHWWVFLNGASEAEWNPVKKPKPKRGAQPHSGRQQAGSYMSYDVAQYEVMYENESERGALVVSEYGEVTEDPVPAAEYSQSPFQASTSTAAFLPTPFASPQPEDRYKASEHTGSGVQVSRPGRPKQPTTSLLSLMDSRYCLHLLMYFTYWITQHLAALEAPDLLPPTSSAHTYAHLTQTHARWIFALLARVDAQLTSDELSGLRALARACLALVKDLSRNQESGDEPMARMSKPGRWVGDPADAPLDERACWIIITAVSNHWAQKDLWMDAESMLNGS